jgi:hypothetical protein
VTTAGADGLAAEADAWLRSVSFGERLGRFVIGELDPLVQFCDEHGADPQELVLLPAAQLLRQAADRLERGLDDHELDP